MSQAVASPLLKKPLSPTQRIAATGLAAAAVAVATLAVQIPVPATGGYLNAGDVAILFFAFLLGPRAGAFAGGIGSAAADFASGYAAYVPVTLVVKGLEGAIAGWMGRPEAGAWGRVTGAVVAALWMVTGYGLWKLLLIGTGPAMATVPGNLVQGGVGVAGALGLVSAVSGRGPKPPPVKR